MPKTFAIALLALLLHTAQAKAQPFSAGITVGLAATQVDGDSYSGYHKAGPIAGIWVQANTNTPWSIVAKFRYIQKGSFAKGQTPGTTIFKLRLNYLELPLLVLYSINSRFSLGAGFSTGYLASLREFNISGAVPHQQTIALRRYEVAAMGGLIINLYEHLRAEAMFSYSAIPLMPAPPLLEHWRNKGVFNNVIELTLSYYVH